uniref:Uncharacterized protein n=1 Tax=Melopsittacus undulatus TaxID=13146 RepID=A0A8C6K0L1_MELUD
MLVAGRGTPGRTRCPDTRVLPGPGSGRTQGKGTLEWSGTQRRRSLMPAETRSEALCVSVRVCVQAEKRERQRSSPFLAALTATLMVGQEQGFCAALLPFLSFLCHSPLFSISKQPGMNSPCKQ